MTAINMLAYLLHVCVCLCVSVSSTLIFASVYQVYYVLLPCITSGISPHFSNLLIPALHFISNREITLQGMFHNEKSIMLFREY